MVPFGGKPPGSEGPGRNRLPTMPFGGKIISVNRGVSTYVDENCCTELHPGLVDNFCLLVQVLQIRWRGITFQWLVILTTDSLLLPAVYLSERGAVVFPQAGTYEYPFLVVGAAPVPHPTALEMSAYRRSASPSRTPKKRLLDHPLRHKHRDVLPPTTN
ncbi:hypothetical protein M5K25_027781 [Dendrobium thyrsiflorum]|uniref:Uncharacterized protein n=1 Tax=Dendrobium thyrsiflorum TaxID=117978 RepID=A0ABD0TUP4_DENTH